MAQPAMDGKTFYGSLFEKDKKPSKVLDALLRGIAKYITESIGDRDETFLSPAKLAAFYKAVGGNYDSLFVEVPHISISWIYASIGCQHTLQPTSDDFAPPSVPALTTQGFVRWQAIEILLGPEEHVPFIQSAVRNFSIINPDTGEAFPVDLPTDAFPQAPDADIERWHKNCAEKLRQRATPTEEPDPRPHMPPRPTVQPTYVHVRPGRPWAETDYFEPKSRGSVRPPLSYQHVSSATAGVRPVRPKLSHTPSHQARQFLDPEDVDPRIPRARRRSVPENFVSTPSPVSTPNAVPHPQPEFHHRQHPRPPPEPKHVRRHSQPRHSHRYSISSDASSSSEGEHANSPTATPRRRSHPHSYPEREGPTPYRFTGPPPSPPIQGLNPSHPRRHRSHERERDRDDSSDRRKKGLVADLSGKLSAPFLLGKREREKEKEKGGDRVAGSRDRERDRERDKEKERANNVKWKDLYNADEVWRKGGDSSRSRRESEEEMMDSPGLPRGYSRDDRERDKEGGRGDYKRREREVGREKERRPRFQERRSSHEDFARRDRERERLAEPIVRGGLGGGSFRERERDRDHERDRRFVSPIRGVDGRRYPSHS